jgi:putative ABC transport system permease protein
MAEDKSEFPKIKQEFQNKIANFQFPEGRFAKILTNLSTYEEALARQIFRLLDGNLNILKLMAYLFMVLFMIVPAINLVNLNLSRIWDRAPEIGIRKSYGASDGTLVLQFLTENIFITIIGGIISIFLTFIIISIINGMQILPDTFFRINLSVIFHSIFIAVIFGILSGVVPAWRMARMMPAEALNGGQK